MLARRYSVSFLNTSHLTRWEVAPLSWRVFAQGKQNRILRTATRYA